MSDQEIRQKYLECERVVRSLGLLYMLFASLLLCLSNAILSLLSISASLSDDLGSGDTVELGAQFFVFLLMAVCAFVLFSLGRSTYKLKRWRNKSPMKVISAGLAIMPVRLSQGLNDRYDDLITDENIEVIFSDDYKRIIQNTPKMKGNASLLIRILVFIFSSLGAAVFLFFLAMKIF